MNNTIEYRGYIGTVDHSEEDNSFGGHLLIDDAYVMYVGRDYDEFIDDFHAAVDDYIDYSKSKADEKNKQYKGSFNARVKNDVHRDAVVYSMKQRTSLNNLIEEAIKDKIYSN